MGFSQLPLVILLISNIHPGEAQETAKPLLTVQPESSLIFRGETVTLTCDIQGDGWTYKWELGYVKQTSEEKELSITVWYTQTWRCQGCRSSVCSLWSDRVTLVVSDTLKPLLTVQPDASQIFRGETVTLTCDLQGERWRYRWRCGDREQISEEKELSITVWYTQTCMCLACRSSFCSQSSNAVTLIVSAPDPSGLSVLKLLGILVAASSFLLLFIILGVKCYRAHARSDAVNQHLLS